MNSGVTKKQNIFTYKKYGRADCGPQAKSYLPLFNQVL